MRDWLALKSPGRDREFGMPWTFGRWQEVAKRAAYPSFFVPELPFEQEAARIHGCEFGAVPGLLQTEDYARSLIRATRSSRHDIYPEHDPGISSVTT